MASAPIGPMHSRVTVRRRFRREVQADGERTARAIVDDDLLADLLRQRRRENARHCIGGAARGLRHDEMDRPIRILRRRRRGEDARGDSGEKVQTKHH